MFFFFFKQKTAYEVRISDWSSDVCSSDLTDPSGTTSSLSPWTMRPSEGQGARKLKSCMLAGGATETKPLISGRRIRSCMPIQAPTEKPAIQRSEERIVWEEGVRTCRSRWWPCQSHTKKKKTQKSSHK